MEGRREGGKEGRREGGTVGTHEADKVIVLLGGEAVKHDVADQLGVGFASLNEREGREGGREGEVRSA